MSAQTILLIGGTGFVGGHLVELLAEKHPDFHLICLIRQSSAAGFEDLKKLNANIEMLEGSLDDQEVISRKAEEVDIVIHLANSDHLPSVEAVLEGLTKQAEKRPDERRPIYLHMSGMGVICDNVKGEKVDRGEPWTDVGFKLEDCPPDNTHLPCDRKIMEAGTRAENSIRTSTVMPGLIYGLGKARRSSLWLPIMANMAKQAGHAGTWGPGEVVQDCIHVQDVASAVACVLDAMLEGKVKGGQDGLCQYLVVTPQAVKRKADDNTPVFIASDEPSMSWKEVLSIMGDIMYDKGLVKEPGSKPFPPEITEPFGHYGWSLLGSNAHARSDRLRELGWEAEWSKKVPIRSVVPEMVDIWAADG